MTKNKFLSYFLLILLFIKSSYINLTCIGDILLYNLLRDYYVYVLYMWLQFIMNELRFFIFFFVIFNLLSSASVYIHLISKPFRSQISLIVIQ